MVQRQDMNDYVCFTCSVFLLYFCSTKNHENIKVDEKENDKPLTLYQLYSNVLFLIIMKNSLCIDFRKF